jgi:nucleoside transporter
MDHPLTWELYLRLSGMQFLEFTIWGAWAPVLASRLLGPLKMTGKQLGWIYGTLPLACIVAPMAAGQVVDRWCPTEYYMAVAHILGGVFLLMAARATRFVPLLLTMIGFTLCYAPTLSLVNSLTFAHLPNPSVNYFRVRVWGSLSWVLIGWALTAWRKSGKWKISSDDCLTLGAICAFIMGVYCFTLPHTPPADAGVAALPFLKAFKLLTVVNFAIFMAISFVATTQLQFYFLGSSRLLEDIGTSHAAVPAAMSIAQAAQVIAMALILPIIFPRLGYQWTLAIGVTFWVVMFIAYAQMRPKWLVISSMALHGLAYAFFFDAAFIYINKVAPTDIRASAQGLYVMVTLGLGPFVGTQFTGFVMERFRRPDGTFRWRPIFLIPCATLAACAAAFVFFFKG